MNIFRHGIRFSYPDPKKMETSKSMVTQLNACLDERQQIADELQNEVNQTLASVLLWIQFTKKENNLMEDKSFEQAEINLKAAIDRIRVMHYFLSKKYNQRS